MASQDSMYKWLWKNEALADATVYLCVASEYQEDKRCYIAHRVHKAVLATHSEYFRAKVLRWTCADEPERSPALKCRDESLKLIEDEACSELDVGGEVSGRVALFNPQPRAGSHNDCTLAEAFDARGEYEAALAVLHFMYNGDLPDEMKWPVNLAQVCLVAERWAVTSLCSVCLQRLTTYPAALITAPGLLEVLQVLPPSCDMLPEHAAWSVRVHELTRGLAATEGALPLLLHLYQDVHAVISEAPLRAQFRLLPFAAVLLWAGSDELVVDSENSVVELLHWYLLVTGYTRAAQPAMSSLVRPQHLSPAYAQGRLPSLAWFSVPPATTAQVAIAANCGLGMAGVLPADKAPAAWSAGPRKQLAADELRQRTTLKWAIPGQQLTNLVAKLDITTVLYSPPMYSAGSSLRLCLQLGQDTEPDRCTFWCWLQVQPLATDAGHVLAGPLPLTVMRFGIARGDCPGPLTDGIIQTNSPKVDLLASSRQGAADLTPFLVNGCLPVVACCHLPCKTSQPAA
ncbi:hypothetical protein V8C86DRAFT_2532058 [Haematococcus lacustris]